MKRINRTNNKRNQQYIHFSQRIKSVQRFFCNKVETIKQFNSMGRRKSDVIVIWYMNEKKHFIRKKKTEKKNDTVQITIIEMEIRQQI